MAEIKKFECRKCGWNIDAPKDGVDLLMDGLFACFVCKDCKHLLVILHTQNVHGSVLSSSFSLIT